MLTMATVTIMMSIKMGIKQSDEALKKNPIESTTPMFQLMKEMSDSMVNNNLIQDSAQQCFPRQ